MSNNASNGALFWNVSLWQHLWLTDQLLGNFAERSRIIMAFWLLVPFIAACSYIFQCFLCLWDTASKPFFLPLTSDVIGEILTISGWKSFDQPCVSGATHIMLLAMTLSSRLLFNLHYSSEAGGSASWSCLPAAKFHQKKLRHFLKMFWCTGLFIQGDYQSCLNQPCLRRLTKTN